MSPAAGAREEAVSNGGDSAWWWKAAVGALCTFVVAATLKGWDNWSTTNDVLTRLDERAKARERWDEHQNGQLDRLEEGLTALGQSLETRGQIGREAIEDLQRRMRLLEEQQRSRR